MQTSLLKPNTEDTNAYLYYIVIDSNITLIKSSSNISFYSNFKFIKFRSTQFFKITYDCANLQNIFDHNKGIQSHSRVNGQNPSYRWTQNKNTERQSELFPIPASSVCLHTSRISPQGCNSAIHRSRYFSNIVKRVINVCNLYRFQSQVCERICKFLPRFLKLIFFLGKWRIYFDFLFYEIFSLGGLPIFI